MSEHASVTLSGLVLNDEATMGLGELCRAAHIPAEALLDMVAEGLLEPLGGASPAQWRFPAGTLTRVRVAVRLQRDLQVNLAGAALALDLLEELKGLRAEVRALERQIRGAPE